MIDPTDAPEDFLNLAPFDGELMLVGDVLVNADLARSLQLVATGGADEFYRGDLARRMVQGLEAGGGLFTVADFAGHQAEVYEPITTTYRGHTVYQTRPPSQGFLLLEMLNLVEEKKECRENTKKF